MRVLCEVDFLKERVLGCLYGGIVGDSFGNSSESVRRAGPLASVTDDTQLTFATCEGVVRHRAVAAPTIAEVYREWFDGHALSGLGAATLQALRGLSAGGHWALVGRQGEYAAGNGAAMRVGPLGFLLDPRSVEHRHLLSDIVRITHRNEEAYCAALAVVAGIRHALTTPATEFLHAVVDCLPDSVTRDYLDELAHLGSANVPQLAARFGTSGFAPETVVISIGAFLSTTDPALFVSSLEAVVDASDDADTIGHLFGQFFGARFGRRAIPHGLLGRVPQIDIWSVRAHAFGDFIQQQCEAGE